MEHSKVEPSPKSLLTRIPLTKIRIRHRLPLLTGLVLLAIIVASSWASYEGVKASALLGGHERLLNLTSDLANMLQQSSVTVANRTLSTAKEHDVRDYVRSPSPTGQERVAELLSQFTAPGDQSNYRVEIWDSRGSVLLTIPSETSAQIFDLSQEFRSCDSEPFRTIGTLRIMKDAVIYPVVAAVRDESGSSLGYLVRWRTLSSNPDSRRRLTDLMGHEATLYFGNASGDVWTDMASVVDKPPGGLASTREVTNYARNGKQVMALGRAVNGTPWFIVVELSTDSLVRPAAHFLRRMLLIGFVLLLIGVASVFAMTRSIAAPLHSLTEAALTISKGDYSKKVPVDSHDELGDLANAFNTMVKEVRSANKELEGKVQQRTRELEQAKEHLELLLQSSTLKRSEAEKERTEAVDALRSTEQQLQQSQKLEAVGRLAGGIAHDFNNLLTAITGYSDLALRSVPDHNSNLQNYLSEIRKASERAASLTRQLLAFSRKQVLQPQVLDLNSVVSDLERMLRRVIGEDIELRTSLAADVGKVKADPTQLEQVVVNLAVNARDAMPNGGKITIETANVYLDESYVTQHIAVVPGRYVMVAVSDNGVGMDQQTLAHIFEPFFTTKEPGKGTGLGLSTVYGIVKQSGGNIWVYSEPEHGTTFKIYLPMIEEDIEQSSAVFTESELAPGSETVLLVEDDLAVRTLLTDVLGGEGYTVLPAASPNEALELCDSYKDKIHLVVTDVVMPGMSGKALVERLIRKRSDLKVLYMSGYTDDAIFSHGVLNPGVAFLQKPFTPIGAAQKLREVLSSEHQYH